jgi:sugar/nucleoside kinase (ribokinase family)
LSPGTCGPGRLLNIGPAAISTGGAVANTGMALHRLGVPVRLMGKVGDDLFGRAVLDVLRTGAPHLADGMIVTPGEATSYSIVISPPDIDRSFLHCPGANDTFGADDVPAALRLSADHASDADRRRRATAPDVRTRPCRGARDEP